MDHGAKFIGGKHCCGTLGIDTVNLDQSASWLFPAWHVVARAGDVTNQPHAVMLCGQAWVLVRLDGQLRAMRDRCPHRLVPLSAGSDVRVDGCDQ
jgi:phenylpropionate dioxygenase-like ring-hydroxylating dioxygenase large terminal subunit